MHLKKEIMSDRLSQNNVPCNRHFGYQNCVEQTEVLFEIKAACQKERLVCKYIMKSMLHFALLD